MATIRKRKGKFQVQVRCKGLAVSRTFIQRKDAQAWARDMELKADRYDLPPDLKVLQRYTLGDLVSRYLKEVTPKKLGSDTEAIVLTAFLRHSISRKTMAELRTADFAQYRDERLAGITPATLKRQLSPLHNLFKIALEEWGLPVKNVLDDLSLSVIDTRRERRLRNGEFTRLIEASRSRRNPYVLPIIVFAVETGMRRSEILAVKWDDFDPNAWTLLIPKSKNGNARTIPLTSEAMRVLIGQPQISSRIFPLEPNAFRLAWERTTARAGIEDFHFHDLRHEAISRFFEKGLTMPEVQSISGHKDVRMLLRYAHAQRETVQRKLDARLDAPASPVASP